MTSFSLSIALNELFCNCITSALSSSHCNWSMRSCSASISSCFSSSSLNKLTIFVAICIAAVTMVRITDAFSTVCIAFDAAVAAPPILVVVACVNCIMPLIMESADDVISPAACMISPATPPIVLPMSSNCFSHSLSVLYKSSHSFMLRLSGFKFSFAFASATLFLAVVTFARAVASCCPSAPSFFALSSSASACSSMAMSCSSVRFAISLHHALYVSSRCANCSSTASNACSC